MLFSTDFLKDPLGIQNLNFPSPVTASAVLFQDLSYVSREKRLGASKAVLSTAQSEPQMCSQKSLHSLDIGCQLGTYGMTNKH